MNAKQITGYNLTWLFVAYEVPHDTRDAKTAAAKFRRVLHREGYLPWVRGCRVLIRHCGPNAQKQIELVRSLVPPNGEVKILQVTDKQFGRMENVWGKLRAPEPVVRI
jgi:CRISPR-associated protein Cas2